MVIGGGPAGMEAARVLALRGHRVVLYEKGAKLGGQVNLAVIPPHKEELQQHPRLSALPAGEVKRRSSSGKGGHCGDGHERKARRDHRGHGRPPSFPGNPRPGAGKAFYPRGSPGRGSADGRKDHHHRRRNGGVRGGRVSGRQRKAGHHRRKASQKSPPEWKAIPEGCSWSD